MPCLNRSIYVDKERPNRQQTALILCPYTAENPRSFFTRGLKTRKTEALNSLASAKNKPNYRLSELRLRKANEDASSVISHSSLGGKYLCIGPPPAPTAFFNIGDCSCSCLRTDPRTGSTGWQCLGSWGEFGGDTPQRTPHVAAPAGGVCSQHVIRRDPRGPMCPM